jgi:hypothetical protein
METHELIGVREHLTTDRPPDCGRVDGVVEESLWGEMIHSS